MSPIFFSVQQKQNDFESKQNKTKQNTGETTTFNKKPLKVKLSLGNEDETEFEEKRFKTLSGLLQTDNL